MHVLDIYHKLVLKSLYIILRHAKDVKSSSVMPNNFILPRNKILLFRERFPDIFHKQNCRNLATEIISLNYLLKNQFQVGIK